MQSSVDIDAILEQAVRAGVQRDSRNGTGYEDDLPPETPATPDGLPTIQHNKRQLRDVTEDALAALIRANEPPTIFERGRLLTRLRVKYGDSPVLEPLSSAALRGVLARVADWVTRKEAKSGPVEEDDAPPMEVVSDLDSLDRWDGIPAIEAVVECPFFTRNGELVITPGYHKGARVWYHPGAGLALPPVPGKPTREEIDQARALLLVELYGDFPFKDDASKAHALAGLILPFVRQMIQGPTPLHLFDAPVEGTGKTLLINVNAIVSLGRPAEATAECSNDEEWRKRITSLLAEGSAFVLLDNLNRTLDSGALASVLTARTWKDRLLGLNKTAVLPNTAVWCGSGNNTRMSRELIRRTVWCRLDARVDAPWERTGFRHPDLMAWAIQNRGQLVWAALTLCQAWIAAGRPSGKQTLGMFESWAAVMGGILDVAGVPGLLDNAKEFRAMATDKASEWRSFVATWWQEFGAQKVGVEELFTLATNQKLLDSVLGDGQEKSQRTKLGLAMSKARDRVYGGFRILTAGEDFKCRKQYRLECVHAVSEASAPPAAREELVEWSA